MGRDEGCEGRGGGRTRGRLSVTPRWRTLRLTQTLGDSDAHPQFHMISTLYTTTHGYPSYSPSLAGKITQATIYGRYSDLARKCCSINSSQHMTQTTIRDKKPAPTVLANACGSGSAETAETLVAVLMERPPHTPVRSAAIA